MRDLTPLPDLVQEAGLTGAARYDPVTRAFLLDSPRPRLPLSAYTAQELRFRILAGTDPEAAAQLAERAEQEVRQRWTTYEEMAARGPEGFPAADRST